MAYVDVLRRNLQATMARRDQREADALLARLREEDPLSEATRALELEYVVRFEDVAAGRRLAAQLVTLHPRSGRILFWSGQAAYRARAWADAERDFRDSLAIEAHWSRERWLGKTLTQSGRLDEAEAILTALWPQYRAIALDLAWLYERRGDPARALRFIDEHLASHPEDSFAQSRRTRLKAQTMEGAELREEVESMVDLGEEVPEAVFAAYLDSLLRGGEGGKAREVVASRLSALPPHVAHDAGWKVYHLQAYDLATDLFLAALPANPGYVKLLNALDRAAAAAGRAQDVAAAYRALAGRLGAEYAKLYGRALRLERRTKPPH